MKRRPLTALAAMVAAALVAGPAVAAPDARGEREITHLLDFVAGSDCRFMRAGTEYDPRAARNHLADKYANMRSRIDSAETFIVYVASASSLSGAAYRVRCGGRESETGPWLEAELWRYRREMAGAKRD